MCVLIIPQQAHSAARFSSTIIRKHALFSAIPQQDSQKPETVPLATRNSLRLSQENNEITLKQKKSYEKDFWLDITATGGSTWLQCTQRCTLTKIRDQAGNKGLSIRGSQQNQYVELFARNNSDPDIRITEANIASTTTTPSELGYEKAQLEHGTCKSLFIKKSW